MVRKYSSRILCGTLGLLLVLWIAVHCQSEFGLTEGDIFISEDTEYATSNWRVNLTSGHRAFGWSNGISNVNSDLQIATLKGESAPAPFSPLQVTFDVEKRKHILSDLQALGWFSPWTLHKTSLRIEYQMDNQQYQFAYAPPYPPEVLKLLQALQINRSQNGTSGFL